MLMLRSIAPAINLKHRRKKTTLQVFFFLFLRQSHLRVFIVLISSTAYAANDNSEKENTIRGFSTFSRGIAGFTE